jgi:hypothetical protein
MLRIVLLLAAVLSDEHLVAPAMKAQFGKDVLIVARLSLDASGRKRYLAVLGFAADKWEDADPVLAVFDMDPQVPKLIAKDETIEWCESVAAIPLAHNGIDLISTYFSAGARSYCENFYWCDGSAILAMADECIAAPELVDLDRDGVDEIVSAPGGPPFTGPKWPEGSWHIYKLTGARLVEREVDYLMRCRQTVECTEDFAGHDVDDPRVITITNETFDSVADPDVEIEVNGECVAEERTFTKARGVLQREIRLREQNHISVLMNDDAVIRVEIAATP